ncbi:MAG: hypothetical protein EPN20_15090 [Magnetospirillum sp.]|nr:MAG: hypothetical protein EPN20_15090 [Magnetospirillum sp.]
MSVDVAKWGLGARLDTKSVPSNPWMHFSLIDSQKMLKQVAPNLAVDLAITEDNRLQAAAGYDPPTILVAGGLATRLCKLAAQLVTAGVFVAFGSAKPEWRPEKELGLSMVEKHLAANDFIWNSAYLPWINDAERQQLFAFLVSSLTRFIVLHELGHIHFGHSRANEKQIPMSIDGDAADEDERREAIKSQAKEIVADSYAFNAHLWLLNAEYERADLDPMRRLLHDKMLTSPRMRLRATLLSAFLVFQLLDRHYWTIQSAMLATHPPAPFRMKSLYATALNLKLSQLPEKEVIEEVSFAQTFGNAVLSVGCNFFPYFDWLKTIEHEAFDSQFNEIFVEMQNWNVIAQST